MTTPRVHIRDPWFALIPSSGLYSKAKSIWLTITFVTVLLPLFTDTFNIDTSSAQIFQGPNISFFGFSVTFHRNRDGDWLLVGAPKADSDYQPTLNGSGAIYKCPLSSPTTCSQIKLDDKGNQNVVAFEKVGTSTIRIRYKEKKDEQWLGVSLASHSNGNGSVVACAHRWTDSRYKVYHFGNGACYEINGDLEFNSTRKLVALTKTGWQVVKHGPAWLYYYGYGQLGMSVHYTELGKTMVLGAPGVRDWTGAVVEYAEGQSYISVPDPSVSSYGYIGYAISSGRFFFDGLMYYVTSAPRLDLYGKVFVYRGRLDIRAQLIGEQLGSYFGAALCVLDLNGDGLDDLLVGAPLYRTRLYEEGRVYVYLMTSINVFERQSPLVGSSAPGARFGTAIASGGDLNVDGYPDVLVGAPYEDDGRGAIYVYNVRQGGLHRSPTQRLAARAIDDNLRGFGHALAKGLLRDGQDYPEVGVGSYGSDSAVVLSPRPVVYFGLHAETHPTKVNPGRINCRLNFNGELRTCVAVGVTFSYSGLRLPANISFVVRLMSDVTRQEDPQQPLPVRASLRNGTVSSMGNSSALLTTVVTTVSDWPADTQWVDKYILVLNREVRDVITPLSVLIELDMVRAQNNDTTGPVLDIFKSRFMTLSIPFDKSCGDDEICLTDLVVDAGVDWLDSKHYVILGNQQPINVNVTLHNRGERAYMTSATIRYPPELQYVRVVKPSTGHVTCNLDNQDGDVKSERWREVLCEFRDPLPDNSTKSFGVILDPRLSRVETAETELLINVTAMTRSDDNNLENNHQVIRIPVKVEAKLNLTGVSKPEQYVYDASQCNRSRAAVSRNHTDSVANGDLPDKADVEILHYYAMSNDGPGLLPSGEVVVRVPVETFDGTVLLNASVQGKSDNRFDPVGVTCFRDQTRSRGKRRAAGENAQEVVSPNTPRPLLGRSENGPLVLNCLRARCAVYRCEHGPVSVGNGLVVTIRKHIRLANLVMLTESGSLMLTTRVTIVGPPGTTAGPHSNTAQLEVMTPINPLVPQLPVGVVPLWVTILAIVIGNLILGGVSFVLYKMGFFKRAQREELDKLIGQNEENEENEIMMRNEVEEWEGYDPYDPWQLQTPETNLLMNINPLWTVASGPTYNLNNNGHVPTHHPITANGRPPTGRAIPIPVRQGARNGRRANPPPVPQSSYRTNHQRGLNNNNNNNNVNPQSFEAREGPT